MVLHEPFILCHDFKCNQQSNEGDSSPSVTNHESSQAYICSQCFAKGKEFSEHKNYHDYSIVKTDFPLFDSEWNADEEMLLLSALLQFGHGNWDDIARQVGPHKSSSECRQHFEKYYIENTSGDFASSFADESKSNASSLRVDEPISCAIRTQEISGAPLGAPIRPIPGSTIFKELAGYNAARAEFDTEYDNCAELELNRIEVNDKMYKLVEDNGNVKHFYKRYSDENEEDEQLNAELSVTMLDVYKNKLRARNKRKRLVTCQNEETPCIIL